MTATALFGSEVRRLLARRVVRWGFLIALGIAIVVVVVATLRSSGPHSVHTMELVKLWRERGGHVEENMVLATSVYLFLLVVGIAATAVGADYRTGTVGTLLTWEPRRVRVAIARIAATATVAVAVYLVVVGVFVGGWALGAATRGSTAGLGPDFWPNLAAVVARCAVAVAVLAVLTAALAFVTRSTVGAVIIWFGYLIGIEAVLGQRVRSLQPGLFIANFSAFVSGERFETSRKETFDAAGGLSVERLFAQPGPGLVRVLVIVAVLVTAAVVLFRRRDVT